MFEKGQQVQLEITDITSEGQGVGRADGLAIFVPDTVVGDMVTAQLTKVKKSYAFSKLVSIDKASPHRIPPRCTYADRCGGCSFALTDYEGQLEVKERQVKEKLTRLGGIEDPKVNPIIGMEHSGNGPMHYRNKASFPISTGGIITKKGGIVENLGECTIGFYRAKSHQVVDCKECMLQSKPAMAAAEALRKYMKEDNITAWDPKWEKGLMRHLIVKTAFGTGEVMVILVINGKGIPNAAKLIGYLDDAIYAVNDLQNPKKDAVEYSLESVVLNINTKKTPEIMGEECITLAGKRTISETAGDLTFEISPMSFYQVNPVQMEKLYEKVLEYANLSGNENILDLYCGIGTIGLYCASHAGQVIGIDSVKQAILDANRNAVINNIVNARYICGRAEEELPKILAGESEDDSVAEAVKNADIAILDPPRAGCRPELLEAVAKAAPQRIIYVSCDPATLSRDIKILRELGYAFAEATPVDMFPWTGHVETVCLLSRKDK